jgi:hypothetical protein
VLTWSRGSIGFVGEVFEVMTQVDQGLTNVSRFDSADSVIGVNDANQKPGASQLYEVRLAKTGSNFEIPQRRRGDQKGKIGSRR